VIELAMQLGAVVLWLAALAVCLSALASRSLFVLAMRLAAGAALAAAGLAALGAGATAMAIALGYAIVGPIALLAVIASSGRTVKASLSQFSVLPSALAGGALGGVVMVALPEMRVFAVAPPTSVDASWVAPLLFVAACICVALLGFGERGALSPQPESDDNAAR
jgi:hypothetical protein